MGLRVRMRQVLPEPAAALVAVTCLQSSRWGNLGVAAEYCQRFPAFITTCAAPTDPESLQRRCEMRAPNFRFLVVQNLTM